MKSTFYYVHDGLADWEAGYVLPELNNRSPFKVRVVGETTAPVTSTGGVRMVPDMALSQLRAEDAAIVILPGGNSWLDPTKHRQVLELLPVLHERQVPIAAICAATVALARVGLLDRARHTSNGPDFIASFVPAYAGAALYQHADAVRDGTIITAPGTGALEFTVEIVKLLGHRSPAFVEQWYQLYKNGVLPPPEFWAQV